MLYPTLPYCSAVLIPLYCCTLPYCSTLLLYPTALLCCAVEDRFGQLRMMAVDERQVILTGLVSDVPYEFKIVSSPPPVM